MHYLTDDKVTSVIIIFKGDSGPDGYRFGFRVGCSALLASPVRRPPADRRLRHHRRTQRAALPLHGSCP